MTNELAKTFDPAAIEAKWYAHWEQSGAFRPARPDAEPFTIVNPPPNVTGSLHIGHALDNTLQDVMIRYERLRGKDALWVVGTDHAGIATQMVVERQLNERQDKRTNYSREDFIAKVWEWKEESGGTITRQLRRLGCSMDWSREQFTMDPHFSAAVTKVFVDLYNQGLITRAKRLVNWDPALKTAISDLEVENREVPGHMWHFKYPLAGGATYTYVERDADGTVTLEEERNYIAIATTRPETMLGDGAVAVHPSDARYAPIVGQFCEIPVGPKAHRRLIPIITDDYPDPAFGSGAVKITGAHDENDYGVAQRNGIPMYRLMDEVAAMRADGAPYAEASAQAMAIAKGEAGRDARRGRRAQPRPRRIPRPRPLRGPQARGRQHRRRGADARGRGQADHATLRRPRRRGHRADADRPVVRRCRDAREGADRGGAGRRHRNRAEELGEDLFQLDGEHPAVVRLAAIVVGPPDSCLVWTRPR